MTAHPYPSLHRALGRLWFGFRKVCADIDDGLLNFRWP